MKSAIKATIAAIPVVMTLAGCTSTGVGGSYEFTSPIGRSLKCAFTPGEYEFDPSKLNGGGVLRVFDKNGTDDNDIQQKKVENAVKIIQMLFESDERLFNRVIEKCDKLRKAAKPW